MYDGKVVIDTSLNNKGFIKGINRMSAQTNGLTEAVKKLGVAIASAFAVKTVVGFGKECVELGSNIAEVQNVVDVAFGDMAYKIEEFADTSIQKFGMSRLAAKKTASTYMAMAKGMGIADDAASDMAITLTGLTGDVASFYNISQELADTKLKSVFTGETETLKDLGVVMTQANLKAFALEQGITKDLSAMSQAELVGLRYNFVLKQLALANGDFARTSDSWANQTRILSMQWQEFMSIVGQSLITVLTPLVKMLNAVVSSLISVANTINSVVSSLFGGANQQIQQTEANAAAVGGAIESSVDNQEALTDATKETAKAQKKLLAGFDEINKLSDAGASGQAGSGTGAGGGIGALVPETVTVDTELSSGSQKVLGFFEDLHRALQPTLDALGRLWESLKLVGSFTGDALRDFYESYLVPIGSWVMGEGLPRFIDAVANGLALIDWQRINDALHTLWEALAPFSINVGEGLLWLWENVLVPFGTWTMNEVVPLFIQAIVASLDAFNIIWDIVKPGLEWLWENFLLPIAKWTGGVIVEVLGWIVEKLELFGDWARDNSAIVEEFAEAVSIFGIAWLSVNKAVSLWHKIGTIAAGVTKGFSAAVALLTSPIGLATVAVAGLIAAVGLLITHWDDVKEIAAACWEGIKKTFSGAAEWFSRVVIAPVTEGFRGFINGLIGYVEGFINFFVRGINKIIDAVNSLSFDIPDILGGGHIGFNLPNVDELKLPRLATGAVIPPNREFMAVLGDQRSGYNIEAPEDLIRKIVREESGGNAQTLSLLRAILDAVMDGKVMMLEQDVFARLVYNANKSESNRVGPSLTVR